MSQLKKLKETTSLSEFAELLGYRPGGLSYILYIIPDGKKYIEFEISKKNGGLRKIKAPIKELKKLQRRLADLLNDCFEEICIDNKKNKSLSHGFRKKHSIITNAKKHKNKRSVFNIDLQDFFPSINFGRVRGFFMKNNRLNLHPKVATVIAQIACHNHELPQGSPCSPIISNLIGHLLDIRMVNLAKKAKCTYSRYADDLTFSTNKKNFPKKIAIMNDTNDWIVGKALKREIEKVGFAINLEKTSMQYKTSRQITTGLVVNEKVNIRKEYYRNARAMCHELFKTGRFYIGNEAVPEETTNKSIVDDKLDGKLNQLEGILSFVYQVKLPHYIYNEKGNLEPTAITKLYRKFLFYKHFFAVEKPLIICEGKTDIIYLKCALKQLKTEYGEFIQENCNGKFNFKIGFLNTSENFKDVFQTSEGSSGCLSLLINYEKTMKEFKSPGKKHPVIILADNDNGSKSINNKIKDKFHIKDTLDPYKYYNFTDNLYIMFVPEEKRGAIEDLFDDKTLGIKIDGKIFNRKNINTKTEYSKTIFAEKVVKARQQEINFDNFKQVFNKFKLIAEKHNEKI
jgi:RNA-directed DNA polymerase